VELNVMWRDAQGRVVSSSWSKSSGWDLPSRPTDRREHLDGSARSVYIAPCDIKHLTQRGSLRDRLPGFPGSVDHPLTTVSWEDGKEVSNI
jgi:hypothetical protein